MTKARTKTQKRRARKKRAQDLRQLASGYEAPPKPGAPATPPKYRAIRPTPERMRRGEIEIPRGPLRHDLPARVAAPDYIAALGREGILSSEQVDAARHWQVMRDRVQQELGIGLGRSCLDMSPVGHDDSDGDEELARWWRDTRTRIGVQNIAILDRYCVQGVVPVGVAAARRTTPALRRALSAYSGC